MGERCTGIPQIEGLQLGIPRRITKFVGQQQPDLQTDEDLGQRQAHNLQWKVEEEELRSGGLFSAFVSCM